MQRSSLAVPALLSVTSEYGKYVHLRELSVSLTSEPVNDCVEVVERSMRQL